MTPEGKPFFAATYIPKTARYGRSGMIELIPQVETVWRERRGEIDQTSAQITQKLQEAFEKNAGDEQLGSEALRTAFEHLARRYDASNGGFGGAPKFPTPHNLLFLLRYWKRTGDVQALHMVEHTLEKMARGGIYDWVGFGFHRYSTDERWFAPHFEKMLYDQALLLMAYTEAAVATGNKKYKRIAEEIVEYVLRDMTDPTGGFYSAEDADSEGVEGKFYLWNSAQLVDLLGEKDGRLVADLFGVEAAGNFSEEIAGANILYGKKPCEDTGGEGGLSVDELRDRLDGIRRRLFDHRETRIHPHKDDKVLTDWNGLMIAALAKSARAFDNPEHAEAAIKAARFVLHTMRDGDGRLRHRYREGEVGIPGNLDDYAFLVWGLIELYETTLDVAYLKTAVELNEKMEALFWDERDGGFFFTPGDGEELIARVKEIYDGAVPSGNSVAMLNLARLGRITGEPRFDERAHVLGRVFFEEVNRSPSAFTLLLSAVEFGTGRPREVVIVGNLGSEGTRAMHRALNRLYLPNMVVLFRPEDEKEPEISQIAPFTVTQTTVDGSATAYVCEDYTCGVPTTDIDTMLNMLK
jgi:uncharacterized protein YyaL (SSP411 family)